MRPRGFEPPRTIRSTRPSTLATPDRWVANPLCSTDYVFSVARTFAQFGARIGARSQTRFSPLTRHDPGSGPRRSWSTPELGASNQARCRSRRSAPLGGLWSRRSRVRFPSSPLIVIALGALVRVLHRIAARAPRKVRPRRPSSRRHDRLDHFGRGAPRRTAGALPRPSLVRETRPRLRTRARP